MKSKPYAVVLSDIHYNLKNLELSDAAVNEAISYAEKHNLPVIIAGDLHDTKALLRGEVVSRMINTFKNRKVPIYVITGNHDLINEKSKEHSLEFLRPYVAIVDGPIYVYPTWWLIPYYHDSKELVSVINKNCNKGSVLIMHQGVYNADMGDYVQDKSAIDSNLLRDYTCISGHYHKHQQVGTLTYIGSPFTMTFGEANDGPKGFLVVNEDGTFERKILNYRKHVIIEHDRKDTTYPAINVKDGDLVWLKIKGPKNELDKLTKKSIYQEYGLPDMNFKLDKIPDTQDTNEVVVKSQTSLEVLDSIIDSMIQSKEDRTYLKSLYKELLDENR